MARPHNMALHDRAISIIVLFLVGMYVLASTADYLATRHDVIGNREAVKALADKRDKDIKKLSDKLDDIAGRLPASQAMTQSEP